MSLIAFLFILAVVIGFPIMIGIYVYRDAQSRSMNATLWTLVAVFAPGLIGLIIYLLVCRDYPPLR